MTVSTQQMNMQMQPNNMQPHMHMQHQPNNLQQHMQNMQEQMHMQMQAPPPPYQPHQAPPPPYPTQPYGGQAGYGNHGYPPSYDDASGGGGSHYAGIIDPSAPPLPSTDHSESQDNDGRGRRSSAAAVPWEPAF
jgi:hypothetical protein